MFRRSFVKAAAGALVSRPAAFAQSSRPNIVLISGDDLGYGDLGCYGSRIRTPNLDAMARDGVRFRQFCSASSVCSPSRAALLTGRYPARVGVSRVLFPFDSFGIPETETTMAQMLKDAGYRTACVGKWHLGSQRPFLPTNRGFDEYFGIPHSHDMWPRPLMRNTEVVEETARLDMLTQRFTQEAVRFIGGARQAPFFLYLPHVAPHIPLEPSAAFKGKSPLGRYSDVVEELDWSVGEVLRALQQNGLDDNTLVIFTSDNGPWYQGSRGGLRGRKGETYEGGMRVPFLARFPGRIPKGLEANGFASALDILPTLARAAGAPLPGQRLDGVDIWPLLAGEREAVEREAFLYFDGWHLQCARMGQWKLHVSRYDTAPWLPGNRVNLPLPHPELYDVDADPQESYDCAPENPQVVAEIRARMETMLPGFPSAVMTMWRDTMNRHVEETPAAAPPVEIRP